ncbi:hypothetical protein B0T22DRAFT_286081 [Podospora appendiculata]|uniref:GDS1 winged helix domain-containing protein n=1 Tax=Podospora appendiculata TaxID=314037 RepID=A0AAE1C891_9PEZI|nr:hypothetical protein B0T22DRAFT_286081 [Podospora appendiculata]
MPYNTRRKSLSLPSLGIHVPLSHAARAANRASPNSSSARANSPASMASPSSLSREYAPPTKKLKRSHREDTDDTALTSEQPLQKKRDDTIKFHNTPPPSPGFEQPSVEMDDNDAAVPRKVDLEGINDEIVEAVIVQLQNSANRPHLVKELAAILMLQLKIVQQSANPCAIISSRLATYLKRPCWTALAPCPLAKELESVHPRRTYFYLTTCPRLPIPDPAHAAVLSHLAHSRTIISPSLSSAASNSEDTDMERRRELSPSPEVDLSSPELDEMDDDIAMPTTPIGSLSIRGYGLTGSQLNHSLGGTGMPGRNHRAASPPLEKDEKEFTQTADGLQKRKLSGDMLSATNSSEQASNAELDYCTKDDNGLFGEKMLTSTTSLSNLPSMSFLTSPTIRPSTMSLPYNMGKRDIEAESWLKLDNMLEWDRSPENIELDELDCLLNDY